MPLSKDVLGQALFDSRNQFNNKVYDQLIQQYGSDDAIRLAACKADAEAIINHFIANGLITVNTVGTASAQSGTGTIQ